MLSAHFLGGMGLRKMPIRCSVFNACIICSNNISTNKELQMIYGVLVIFSLRVAMTV